MLGRTEPEQPSVAEEIGPSEYRPFPAQGETNNIYELMHLNWRCTNRVEIRLIQRILTEAVTVTFRVNLLRACRCDSGNNILRAANIIAVLEHCMPCIACP